MSNTKIPSSVPVETPENKTDLHRHSSSMEEAGYIVFSFKDNETFHIVKEHNSEKSSHFQCTSKQIRRKLQYEEDLNVFEEDKVDFEPSTERVCDAYDEVEDEESIYFDPELPSQAATLGEEEEEEEEDDDDDDEYEASTSHSTIIHESSASDGSAGSFAFPVLSRVWSGSPIKMPRTKSKHLRKHKDWRLALLCCRF